MSFRFYTAKLVPVRSLNLDVSQRILTILHATQVSVWILRRRRAVVRSIDTSERSEIVILGDLAEIPVHTDIGPEARKLCRTPDKPKVGDLGDIWGILKDNIIRTSKRYVYNALIVNTRPSPRSDLTYAIYPPGYASLTWGSTYFTAVLCSLSNLEQSAFGDDEPLTIFFIICTGNLACAFLTFQPVFFIDPFFTLTQN